MTSNKSQDARQDALRGDLSAHLPDGHNHYPICHCDAEAGFEDVLCLAEFDAQLEAACESLGLAEIIAQLDAVTFDPIGEVQIDMPDFGKEAGNGGA